MGPRTDEAGEAVQMLVASEQTNNKEEDRRFTSRPRSVRNRWHNRRAAELPGAKPDEAEEVSWPRVLGRTAN